MKSLSRLSIIGALILSAVIYSCSASPEYGKYQTQLSNQMQDMRNVINAGHYNQFLTTYINPSYMSAEGGVDKVMVRFNNSKQQELYRALGFARNIPPIYDEGKRTLTYLSSELSRPLIFKMVGTKWYMEGDWLQY